MTSAQPEAAMKFMPFGKWKGKPITELKDTYLDWLMGLDDLREPLKSAIEHEVQRRGSSGSGASSAKPNGNGKAAPSLCPSPELAEEIVSIGMRTISQRFDPDKAADHEAVVLLHDTAKWMRLKAWETA